MKLFPKYLPKGSKGPAAVVLQLLLIALDLNSDIVPDGDFGEQTAKGVREFQALNGLDQDGDFGPATRAAFLEAVGIDINALESDLFAGMTSTPEGSQEDDYVPTVEVAAGEGEDANADNAAGVGVGEAGVE